jgi:Galactose oxidase, central domain
MQDSKAKLLKFRQTPIGKFICEPEIRDLSLDSYTLALLSSDTSEQLYKSYWGFNSSPKKRNTRSMQHAVLAGRNETSVYWTKVDVDGWKPETRQEATLTEIQDKFFLIGGVSRSISKDVNTFSLASRKWHRQETAGQENEPRFGHSSVKYENNIIVFGGGTNYDIKHKLRECLNGVHMFYTLTSNWEYVKTQGTYLPARKYHSAEMIASHMFIYGGMNQKNNLLADAAILNLKKKSWKSVEIKGTGPGKLAFHASGLVLNPLPTTDESIYEFSSTNANIKHPGIYIFGGITADKKASNGLYVVKIGKKPLEWSSPITSGQAPCPRFLHTMVYNSLLNLLIVFGGRVDLAKTSVYTCFNDVHLLDLASMVWLQVKVFGEVPVARSGHTAESVGSRIYVFGGVANTCYCSSDFWMLELDSSIAYSMGKMYKNKIEKKYEIQEYKLKSNSITRQATKSFSRSHTKRFTRDINN